MESVKTQFVIEESILVKMFCQKMARMGHVRKGNHNYMDLAYEKVRTKFQIPCGPNIEECEQINVHVDNATWVIIISFYKNGKKIEEGTWDPDGKIWVQPTRGFIDMMYQVFVYGIHETEIKPQKALENPLGDYYGRNE